MSQLDSRNGLKWSWITWQVFSIICRHKHFCNNYLFQFVFNVINTTCVQHILIQFVELYFPHSLSNSSISTVACHLCSTGSCADNGTCLCPSECPQCTCEDGKQWKTPLSCMNQLAMYVYHKYTFIHAHACFPSIFTHFFILILILIPRTWWVQSVSLTLCQCSRMH